MQRLCLLLCLALASLPFATAPGQTTVPSLNHLYGLRSSSNHVGGLKAAAYLPDGTVVLLYDEGTGLHLVKADASLSTVLAEAQAGAAGDTGVALAVDPQGDIYVGGTSGSGTLTGTSGAAFPAPADASLNSFVAKFDRDLNLTFLSFLGTGHTALSGLAVTADAVFVTGSTYSATLPTTTGALQPVAPSENQGNGFLERLSSDGTRLRYATYLGGADGSTTPTALVADNLDDVYVAGSTSTPSYPVAAALQATMLGTVSGFASRLNPAGTALIFSTYIPGAGIASLALSQDSSTLFLTGDVAPASFPIADVPGPLADTAYQTLLRLSADGQTLEDAVRLFPGSGSAITLGPGGDAWVTGGLSIPLTELERHAGLGDSYTLHLGPGDNPDRALRLGGIATNNIRYAAMSSALGPAALDAASSSLLIPGTVTLATDPTLIGSQAFDLALSPSNTPPLFPNPGATLLPSACVAGQPCAGSGGFLAQLGPPGSGAVLTISAGDLPTLTVRNISSTAATGLSLSSTAYRLSTTCTQTLSPGEQCGAILSGSGPGTVTLSGTNSSPEALSFTSLPASPPQPLLLSESELDFGIVTASFPVTRTVTVANLGAAPQTFTSVPEGVPSSAPYTLAETASTCAGTPEAHVIPALGSCTITLGLTASSQASDNGQVKAAWKIGARDLLVTGFTQASPLSLSSAEIVFGPQSAAPGARLPRFLYLSNPSPFPIAHTAIELPPDAPFEINDDCPSLLEPQSVCQIGLFYLQTVAPSLDTLTLTLDMGLTVLVTGETTAAPPPPATLPVSPLQLSPATISFTNPVVVGSVSAETQPLQITNTSSATLPITTTLLGDYLLSSPCPSELQPGASCVLALRFAPSQTGQREGLLTVSAGPNFQAVSATLSATGSALLSDPQSSLDLGESPLGEPVVRWLQVTNTLPTLTVNASGTPFGVALLGDNGSGHGTLAPAAFAQTASASCVNCWLAIQFWPQSAGAAKGAVHVSSDAAGNPYTLAVRGVGLPTQGLLLTPTQSNFGAIPVHSTSASLVLSLTNLLPGSAAANITSITTTGDFSVADSPHACPATLAPTASCAIAVVFAPTAPGLRSGTLTVITDAGAISTALTGIGTPDGGLSATPSTLVFQAAGPDSITLKNTGTIPVALGTPTADIPAFVPTSACSTLAPGQTCTVLVAYTPQSTTSNGTLTVPLSYTDTTGQTVATTYAISLTGASTQATAGLSIFPTQADFGLAATGALGISREFTLTNTSGSAVTLQFAATRNFPLASQPDCGMLAPDAACTFSIIFVPETSGSLTGSLVATALALDGSPVAQTTLYTQGFATGDGALTASAGNAPEDPLDFGSVTSGGSASAVLTLTNTGTTSVNIRRLSTTAPFHATGTCPTLAPAASCSLALSYAPSDQVAPNATLAPRGDGGTLSIESDAEPNPGTIYLAGRVTPTTTNSPDTTALPTYTLSESALTFPNTPPGTSSPAQFVTLHNTGSMPLDLTAITPPPGFAVTSTCSTVQPAATCTVTVVFTPPADAPEATHTAALQLGSNAADSLEFISLLGSAAVAPLQVSASAIDFGDVVLGATAEQSLTLQNTATLPLPLGATNNTGDFSTAAGTCPPPKGSLPAGGSCTLLVRFAPSATGRRSGALTITSAGGSPPLQVTLSGTGTAGRLDSDLQTIDFGTVILQTSGSRTLTLNNTGTASLTGLHLAITGPDATAFRLTTTCPPANLPVNATCTGEITFTPNQPGPYTATLSIASSDPSGPTLVPLRGTGAQTPGFTLTVNGSSSVHLNSGGTASFALLVTPQGGYATPVTLSCTPVTAAPNALCSLASSSMSLIDGPATGSVTLTTASGILAAALTPWNWLFLSSIVWISRKRQHPASRRWTAAATLFSVLLGAATLLGCAGGSGSIGAPYTPPGTYTYKVTAQATQGAPLISSVTLTVTVQ